jgi:hypothetical protein
MQIEIVSRQVMPMLEPLGEALRRSFGRGDVRGAVDFGAITSGKNDRFLYAWQTYELAQRFRQLFTREYDFLADVDGRGAVIDSYDDE